ncbi:uncharacterized protein AB675_3143 [Cyphellophora attinorum]|uniref:Uncharacterized protein n=1 Tax=Cyphellophora attinorum TaxID=1664694 RepID=A0A0N1NZ67_9EURO|nr:uncharacterized protein AB675_3143 [Phialophora attinorum]KPI37873.1 hypothetical protein AB675_3143 [Phialophora attinorum]
MAARHNPSMNRLYDNDRHGKYSVPDRGVNVQGNRWVKRSFSDHPSATSYRYSNADQSYYYRNPDGSTYYEDTRGRAKYTTPQGREINYEKNNSVIGEDGYRSNASTCTSQLNRQDTAAMADERRRGVSNGALPSSYLAQKIGSPRHSHSSLAEPGPMFVSAHRSHNTGRHSQPFHPLSRHSTTLIRPASRSTSAEVDTMASWLHDVCLNQTQHGGMGDLPRTHYYNDDDDDEGDNGSQIYNHVPVVEEEPVETSNESIVEDWEDQALGSFGHADDPEIDLIIELGLSDQSNDDGAGYDQAEAAGDVEFDSVVRSSSTGSLGQQALSTAVATCRFYK